METEHDLGEALAAVGPRLRAIRQQRETTLAELSAETGISVSTLSRLESGQRRPTLELLLLLARAHGVQLDELVEPPPTDDPRVQLRPITREGMTMIPLSRHASGLQAYKVIITARRPACTDEPRTHDGYEWLYVLSGRLRLKVGNQDLTLGPGEAAEFDTRVPHFFESADDGAVEILSLFGPQGERMHLRARPRRPGEARPG